MKYIAKRVPDEWQECEDWKTDVQMGLCIVYGNNDYEKYTTPLFDTIIDNISYISDLENASADEKEESIYDIFGDYLKRGQLSEIEIDSLIESACESYSRWKHEKALADMLSTLTGILWDYSKIRGYLQGEWNYLFYQAPFEPYVSIFETQYFNMGTEWEIIVDDKIDTCVYCIEWDIENQIKEIKRAICFNEKEDELKLYDVKMVYKPEYVEMGI